METPETKHGSPEMIATQCLRVSVFKSRMKIVHLAY